MSYAHHRTLSALPDAGAVDASLTPIPITSGTPKIGVLVRYKKNAGSTTGYPGFGLAWTVPAGTTTIEVLESVRLGTITASGLVGPMLEYLGLIECRDLKGVVNEITGRVIEVFPGAVALRLVPAEVGDVDHPGECELYVGRD